MKLFSLLLAASLSMAFGQSTVYLRDRPPGQYQVTGTSTFGDGTVQMATLAPHGLTAGNAVGQWNICGTTNATGHFYVRAVQDATHFTVEHLDHSNVTLNAAWCTGSFGGVPGGPQFGGLVTAYALPSGPKGSFLDGWNGYWTRLFTIRTTNGLISLTSASNVLTMVTSFVPDLAVGDKVGIWGTTNTVVNAARNSVAGSPWTVASITPGSPNTTLTLTTTGTTSSIPDADYATNNSCGASGTSPCVSVSQRGWHGAPAFDGTPEFDLMSACGQSYNTYDPQRVQACAIRYLIDPTWTTQANNGITTTGGVVSLLQAPESHLYETGGTVWADETRSNAGVGDAADLSFQTWIWYSLLYSAASDYLTTPQKQHFAQVFLNDLPDGCTKNLPVSGPGTVTLSGTTITGSSTTFTSTFTVGDFLVSDSGLNSGYGYSWMYRITAIASNTSMTVVLPLVSDLNGTASSYNLLRKWGTGMCGVLWLKRHWAGSAFGHPLTYPPSAGGGAYPGPYGNGGSNNQFGENWGAMALGAAVADDDTRGAMLFESQQNLWWDKQLSFQQAYSTGFNQSGPSYYGYNRTPIHSVNAAAHLAGLIPLFPSMDLTGAWSNGIFANVMYSGRPDVPTCQILWGANPGSSCPNGDGSPGFNPSDPEALIAYGHAGWTLGRNTSLIQYWWDWLNVRHLNVPWQNTSTADIPIVWMDQRTARLDHTTQPTQYLFRDSGKANCQANIGAACDYRADVVASRTGWSSADDTAILYQSRSYTGDHDTPQHGATTVYKRNYLQMYKDGDGSLLDNSSQLILSGTDYTYNDAVAGYAGRNPSKAYLTRWSGSDPYGDASSRYVYAMSDETGMFITPPTVAQRHFIHLKKSGTEEILAQIDKVDASNVGGTVSFHNHYWIIGGNTASCAGTTCTVQESNVSPLLWGQTGKYLGPTATFVDDGTGFANATGRTHRVSVSGTGTTLESMVVHRIAAIGSLTISTATVLTDSSHYVVTADDKVIGTARVSAGLVAGYPAHTIPSGITQAIYTDLQPGRYVASVGGAPIGAPCVSVTGNNVCYFEPGSVSGSMVVTQTVYIPPSITTASLPDSVTGTSYSQTLIGTSGSLPYTWSIQSGTLPLGFSLNSSGTISGAPTSLGLSNFVVLLTDADGGTDTKALSIQVSLPPPPPMYAPALIGLPNAINRAK